MFLSLSLLLNFVRRLSGILCPFPLVTQQIHVTRLVFVDITLD